MMRGLIAETLVATSDVEFPVSANARRSDSPTSASSAARSRISGRWPPLHSARAKLSPRPRAQIRSYVAWRVPTTASSRSGVVTAGSFDQSVVWPASPPPAGELPQLIASSGSASAASDTAAPG